LFFFFSLRLALVRVSPLVRSIKEELEASGAASGFFQRFRFGVALLTLGEGLEGPASEFEGDELDLVAEDAFGPC
jgi:hypothetical protein